MLKNPGFWFPSFYLTQGCCRWSHMLILAESNWILHHCNFLLFPTLTFLSLLLWVPIPRGRHRSSFLRLMLLQDHTFSTLLSTVLRKAKFAKLRDVIAPNKWTVIQYSLISRHFIAARFPSCCNKNPRKSCCSSRVYHPKKQNKIKVVFDYSAKLKNVSLDRMLIQGRDLTN